MLKITVHNNDVEWYSSGLPLQLELNQKLSLLADQCVKCGMCLPGCPTYQISKNENESPRGRIALMQGIMQGDLQLTGKVKDHLDHCVSCLSCEKICPSTVQYETLIDGIREYTVTQQNNTSAAKLISFLISPAIQSSLFMLLRFYQLSGIQTLLRKSGLLKLIGLHTKEQLLPKLSARLDLKPHYPTELNALDPNTLNTVALFSGCMGNLFEQKAIQSSIQVLNTLGYNVAVPEQVCCGALHQHSGFRSQADELAEKNRQSFLVNKNYAAILFTASGCGAQLKTTLKESSVPVTSVMQFIQQHTKNVPLKLNTIEQQNVAVHQPCSLKNILGEDAAVIQLLNSIPGLTISELDSQCCGAAGKNMLTQANLANQIRQPLLEQIQQASPDAVVSSNIGCALHLMAGLNIDNRLNEIPLLHPIELLAKSLA